MTTANNPVVTADVEAVACEIESFMLGRVGHQVCVNAAKAVLAMTQASPPPDEMVSKLADAIQYEARNNGADSPVDYGDAEQLARAALQFIGPLMRERDEAIVYLKAAARWTDEEMKNPIMASAARNCARKGLEALGIEGQEIDDAGDAALEAKEEEERRDY